MKQYPVCTRNEVELFLYQHTYLRQRLSYSVMRATGHNANKLTAVLASARGAHTHLVVSMGSYRELSLGNDTTIISNSSMAPRLSCLLSASAHCHTGLNVAAHSMCITRYPIATPLFVQVYRTSPPLASHSKTLASVLLSIRVRKGGTDVVSLILKEVSSLPRL